MLKHICFPNVDKDAETCQYGNDTWDQVSRIALAFAQAIMDTPYTGSQLLMCGAKMAIRYRGMRHSDWTMSTTISLLWPHNIHR